MSAYAADSGQTSRRTVVLFVIIALHLLIGWAFVSGFGHTVAQKVIEIVNVEQIVEQKQQETPPPPPKVDLNLPPPVAMPPPVVNIQVPVDIPPAVRTEIRTEPAPAPRVVTPGTPIQLITPPDPNSFYPEQSLRLNEEGNVTVKLCVGADGKFEGEPTLTSSSGSENLDGAAIRWGKAVRRAKAATVDGKPVRSCKEYRIKFVNPNKH